MSNNPVDTQVNKEGWADFPGTQAETALHSRKMTAVKQVLLLQPMENQIRADLQAIPHGRERSWSRAKA